LTAITVKPVGTPIMLGPTARCSCASERERLNRVKHAITLSPDDVQDDAGLSASDIDFAAITTTQQVD
jgi:hypothetical protein